MAKNVAYNSPMSITILNFIWLFVGLVVAISINGAADALPSSRPFPWPPWQKWSWSQRKRPLLILLGTATLFFCLPTWMPQTVNLIVNSFHIAVLLLIIVTDLEHRLIFNAVVYPSMLIALVGSAFVTDDENTLLLALIGGLVGLLLFGGLYLLANLIYGRERIPLGLGDVKLAALLGLMLGFHRIFFCLFWGIVLGGVITLLLLLSGRVGRRTALPYGQYLALSGIYFLIWGVDYAAQFIVI